MYGTTTTLQRPSSISRLTYSASLTFITICISELTIYYCITLYYNYDNNINSVLVMMSWFR